MNMRYTAKTIRAVVYDT